MFRSRPLAVGSTVGLFEFMITPIIMNFFLTISLQNGGGPHRSFGIWDVGGRETKEGTERRTVRDEQDCLDINFAS